jgi:hypothetical protein
MTARPSATVIAFPQDRVRPAGTPECQPCAADVLFFTGVRIERLAEETDALPAPGSGVTPTDGRRQRR